MKNLPIELQNYIHEYDDTYKVKFERVLEQIRQKEKSYGCHYYTNDVKDYCHNMVFQINWNVDEGLGEDFNYWYSVYTSIFSDDRNYFDEVDKHNIKIRPKKKHNWTFTFTPMEIEN